MAKVYIFFGFACCLAGSIHAQETISLRDANEINYQAKLKIRGLQNLLNYVTFKDNAPSEVQEAIDNSYDPASRNHTFESKDIIIQDDVDPDAKLGSSADATVHKYLTDLDLKYEKSTDESISLTNLKVSTIKKKNYIYVKITFDSKFGNKYSVKKSGYPVRQREAEIKAEKTTGNTWDASIVSINFYNPDIPVDSLEKNNMLVTADSTISSGIVSTADLAKQQAAYDLAKAAEEKKKEADFQDYLKEGHDYIAAKNYKDGLMMFAKAKGIKPLVPSLDKAILDGKRDSALYNYDTYKVKGDNAQSGRQYVDAIKYYNVALSIKPEANGTLQPIIDNLKGKLAIVALPSNKLQAGDPKGAIEECERILNLKENKKSKNNFPELFYIEGLAYQKQLENNVDASSSKDKALENFNFAIQYFPNYTEAHLARANFYVRYKNDKISAITDYDQLAINALENAPERPGYFVQKAKWKDDMGNYQGAVTDYATAISLNPKADSIYYDRGEMLYRMQKYDDAKKSLDTAIDLNAQNNLAFYTRGLNYVGLNDNDKAGADFVEAQRLGISTIQSQTIDSISNKYYYIAIDSAAKHSFASADIMFDNALKIKSCNAFAFKGKADIRFTTGEELADKNQAADAKKNYLESIEYTKKAINCNPNYSDAFYKQGLAQERTSENDLAYKSFSEAIRSDNTNIQAYIERGGLELQLQKYNKAEEDYTQALSHLQINYDLAKKDNLKDKVKSIDLDRSLVNQLDGEAFYYLADFTNAVTALNKALDINENNSEALYFRGRVYYDQTLLSKSITDFDQAIKIMSACKYFFADGNANFRDKNYEGAIKHYTFVVQLDTLNTFKKRYYLLGLSFFKSNLNNEALNNFDAYNKTDASKTDTAFFADYGMAQLFAGKYDDAFKNFNQALTLSPSNSWALFGLGCYYAKTGAPDKVLDLMQKAFSKNEFTRDDIKKEEEAFLADFNKNKPDRVKYGQIRKQYLTN